jgi:hypothetical protein
VGHPQIIFAAYVWGARLWDFAVATGKALRSKNLAGRLHSDGVGRILSVDREIKTEIPA